MKTPNPIKTLIFSSILATLMVGSGHAAIVPLNGDFETNTFVAGGLGPYSSPAGGSSISNWSWSESAAPYPTGVRLISQDIDFENAVGGKAASHGTYAVSLEGATSSISQNITLAAGQYQLIFDASWWLPAYLAVNPIYASLGGVKFSFSGSTAAFSPTQGYNTYTSDVFTVTTAGTYELKIAADNPAGGYSGGTAVDGIRLKALNNGPILSNGNFEDSVYGDTGTQDYSPPFGRSFVADWSWSSTTQADGLVGAVRLLETDLNGGVIPDGSTYAVSLEGATSWIKQSVTLNPGQYQLRFDAATPLLQYLEPNPIYASFDGVNLSFNGSTNAFSPTLNYVRYTSDVFTVTTAGTYELKIAANNPKGGYSGSSAVANLYIGTELSYGSWAANKAGGQAANLDWDNDGVSNGVEYFMNAAPGFTANPGFVGNTVTWTNGGKIPSTGYGTQFAVQTSSDLVTWEDVAEGDLNSNSNESLSYSVDPTNAPAKQFFRLKVTP
ncbi:MAG: hypothetical protein KGQ87_00520 [Verrucomicrobia bacterium]|nr:hypothetical protein [Verrucomicrobiota bacterium]